MLHKTEIFSYIEQQIYDNMYEANIHKPPCSIDFTSMEHHMNLLLEDLSTFNSNRD